MTVFRKKFAWAFAALVAAALVFGTVKLEVPPHLRGELVAQGRIKECEFQRIGRHGGEFFMGVTLETPGSPYLRLNGPSSERATYEALCARKPVVRITYRAIKRLAGPIRFWILNVAEG
jgi:hypothetical protein